MSDDMGDSLARLGRAYIRRRRAKRELLIAEKAFSRATAEWNDASVAADKVIDSATALVESGILEEQHR